MSRSVNKVILIGNLGADPEVRTTSGGGRVAKFNLATTRTWNGANGEKQEKTEWHRCVAWNAREGRGTGLADVVERYAKKGDRIYVEGMIEYSQYKDKEGQTRYSTDINVREIMLLGNRGGGDSESGSFARSRPAAKAAGATAAAAAGGEEFEDFPGALEEEDDDLPF